jgi:tetratricopeptide (TPR) repeat protein
MNTNKVPQVFLSLSGTDDAFVEKVRRELPDGLAFFYMKSFKSGANLIDAMQEGIERASIFVLFASKASLNSVWVKFEIDRARLASIQRPNLKIIIFPIEPGVSHSDLPDWMREFWINKYGETPKDIARRIRHLISTPPFASPAFAIPVIGRGAFVDLASQRLMLNVADTQRTPNVFIFAGLGGIGRRTAGRQFLEQTLPSLPDLSIGPEFQLPQFADLADLYRKLRENIETDFSVDNFQRDLEHFRTLEIGAQLDEIVKCTTYFGDLGQAVFIATGSGLFEDRGSLKTWVGPLFTKLDTVPQTKVCIVTNRQLRDEELQHHGNVLQLHVPPLGDSDIRALMTATCRPFGIPAFTPAANLVKSIGGHPQIAKAAVRLVAQRGEHILQKSPHTIFSIQDEILGENLDISSLSPIQNEILCLLSWVPQLDAVLLEATLRKRNYKIEAFIEGLENLILGSLVIPTENNYLISPAIREMFRRKYGYGPAGLLSEFSKVLRAEWNASQKHGPFRSDIFDAFVFMHALEGKSLPNELKSLLLPSTLQEVVKESYARGRDEDDHESLKRVTIWGAIADQMTMDDSVRQEILSNVIRAHIRLRDYTSAEAQLKLFDQKGYSAAFLLRGFMLRRKGDFREAIPHLKEAARLRKYDHSAIQELANCYQKLGMVKELAVLVNEHKDMVERSASLLDFRVNLLIGSGKLLEAESAIERLARMPEDQGRSTRSTARILIQKNDFAGAKRILTHLLNNAIGNAVAARRWRAIAAARDGDFELARQDINFIKALPGRELLVDRLEFHFALAKRDEKSAESILGRIGNRDSGDSLQIRILEYRANDITRPLHEREGAKHEAAVLRAKNKGELDADWE